MEGGRLSYLLTRYRTNLCTREELEELFLIVRDSDESLLLPGLQEQWECAGAETAVADADWSGLFEQIRDRTHRLDEVRAAEPRGRMRLKRRRRWLVAATGLFFLVGGGAMLRFIYLPRPRVVRAAPAVRRFKNDVQPGGNKAILTLADGSSIVLDSAGNGTLSIQGNTKILKLASGSLAYQQNRHGTVAEQPVYNTISTPRGGQYQVMLPDGSKVWLDAGSSLRFPTSFTGGMREVQLSGEAYFDIAANPQKPFRVDVRSGGSGKGAELQHIDVLGTQFNIMAYADEAMVKTTLLEGAVRVGAATGGTLKLAPGDQSQLDRLTASHLAMVQDADVDAAVAWKNGYFDFNKADIQTIMRQLARWYDVDVSFRGHGSRDHLFYGGMQRNLPLSAVFDILGKSGVMFSIDGKKVIVDL
jgi:transmembrane sensor